MYHTCMINGSCMGCACISLWIIHGKIVEYAWAMHGFINSSWIMHGPYADYRQIVLDYALIMYGLRKDQDGLCMD